MIWVNDPTTIKAPAGKTAGLADLQKKWGNQFSTFGQAYDYASAPNQFSKQYNKLGARNALREQTRKADMGSWLKDNAPVGGWKYSYGQKTSGPISPGSTMSIDYGSKAGQWSIRKRWEGKRDPNIDTPGYFDSRFATMPSSWNPSANQFPWQQRRGITSDYQRQGAYNLGFGGGRGRTEMARKLGGVFDPRIATFQNRAFFALP